MRYLAHLAFCMFACMPLVLGCGSPLVGAECKSGYSACDGRCVKLDDDPHDCGSCGHDCGNFSCNAGKCTTKIRMDAGMDAGSGDDDGGGGKPDTGAIKDGSAPRPDAGMSKTPIGSPFLPDGGVMFPDSGVNIQEPDGGAIVECALGETECGGACVDTRYDLQHCGDCATACGADQFCKLGTCTLICDPPLKRCNGACVDQDNDENHCGSCNTSCVSGICNAGVCGDVIPGSLVVIGHDFTSANDTMRRIAGNALFLTGVPSVRVLNYVGGADPNSVAGVNAAFNLIAASTRTWHPIEADADRVSEQLRDADAFVIYAQKDATDVQLAELGVKWRLALAQFLFRGGIVIVFETMSAKNTGTYHILDASGLFAAASRAPIVGNVVVEDLNNGVASRASSTYAAAPTSVRFVDVTTEGTAVVTFKPPSDMTRYPVVFRRVTTP